MGLFDNMKPFRERNHTTIGFIGIALILAMMIGAFRADRLPIIGAGDVYKADFAEIGQLHSGSEVRVAGVTVGKVREIELVDGKAQVTFKIDKGTELGSATGAEIKTRTLLGAQYLRLHPAGSGQLEKGSVIPASRTISPYNIVDAFSDLSRTTDEIDLAQVSEALTALSDIASETPEEFRGAIKGVSDLSANLAARDEQINTLLVNLRRVSKVLNDQGPDLVKLFEDASELFDAIAERRNTVHRLLVNTEAISNELVKFVQATKKDLKPVLQKLEIVTDMLRRNEASIDEALRLYPNFIHGFSDALAVGPWWDIFIKVGGA
jgi:phospholipid/cholesterol/gamma-HCH transport system substrate-binding protein